MYQDDTYASWRYMVADSDAALQRIIDRVRHMPVGVDLIPAAHAAFALAPNEWAPMFDANYPRLHDTQRGMVTSVLIGNGTCLIDPLLIRCHTQWMYEYSGVPLGPLADVRVYARNLSDHLPPSVNGFWEHPRLHAIGCKHHPDLDERTGHMTLTAFLALDPAVTTNTCAKCGGLSCDRLTDDQFTYLMHIKQITDQIDCRDPLPDMPDLGAVPPELVSWHIMHTVIS